MATSNHSQKSIARIEQNKILKLELEDSEALVNALLNPPKPNEALKAAALRYKKEMSV